MPRSKDGRKKTGGKPQQAVNKLEQINNTRIKIYSVSLEDPLAFGKLYGFTKDRHDIHIETNILYKGDVFAVLKKKPYRNSVEADYGSEAQFVYSYDKNVEKDLTYENFGEELAKNTDETVELITRLILRYMRFASRQDQTQYKQNKTEETLALVEKLKNIKKDSNAKYTPLELFAQLLGSAASEAGRATTGYVNFLATMRRISKLDAKDRIAALTQKIFPSDYVDENLDQTRHATGFEGSQNIMRFYSELETNFNKSNMNSPWKERYKKMLERDIEELLQSKKTNINLLKEKVLKHMDALEEFNKPNWQPQQPTVVDTTTNNTNVLSTAVNLSSPQPTAANNKYPCSTSLALSQLDSTKKLLVSKEEYKNATGDEDKMEVSEPLRKTIKRVASEEPDDISRDRKRRKLNEVETLDIQNTQTVNTSTKQTYPNANFSPLHAVSKLMADFAALPTEKGRDEALKDLLQKVEEKIGDNAYKLHKRALNNLKNEINTEIQKLEQVPISQFKPL